MTPRSPSVPLPLERRIHIIRGVSVMLDADLADLYGVTTKAMLQAIRRNAERFPSDFLFSRTRRELAGLRSQTVTSKSTGSGGRRYATYAFTEQGVAMLSSVLRSPTAVAKRVAGHDVVIQDIGNTIQDILKSAPEPSRPIGFTADLD